MHVSLCKMNIIIEITKFIYFSDIDITTSVYGIMCFISTSSSKLQNVSLDVELY